MKISFRILPRCLTRQTPLNKMLARYRERLPKKEREILEWAEKIHDLSHGSFADERTKEIHRISFYIMERLGRRSDRRWQNFIDCILDVGYVDSRHLFPFSL